MNHFRCRMINEMEMSNKLQWDRYTRHASYGRYFNKDILSDYTHRRKTLFIPLHVARYIIYKCS